MTSALMWGLLLLVLVGLVWAVRVMTREVPQQWAWLRRDKDVQERPMLELPHDFVVVPGDPRRRVPKPRPERAPLRRVG